MNLRYRTIKNSFLENSLYTFSISTNHYCFRYRQLPIGFKNASLNDGILHGLTFLFRTYKNEPSGIKIRIV